MPLYHFRCTECDERTRAILEPDKVKGRACEACGGPLERDPRPPSTQVLEKLDNGLMPRAIERLKDAESLHRDRATRGPKDK